jgi:hypothetical protein
LGGATGGRAFVRKCLDLGVDRIADAYSLHYTWPLHEKDFPAFFRREMSARGRVVPLVNSEESTYGRPSDVVKLFARDLFLYDFDSVYYYLSRDWFEAGNLISSGLFDRDWHPKLRLLSYALSVDAMKDRELVGIAEPAKGVEAYVLRHGADYRGHSPTYSIVMWRNGGPEELGTGVIPPAPVSPVAVTGVSKVASAWTWRLDRIPYHGPHPGFMVGGAPIVVFTNNLPKWKTYSPQQWLSIAEAVKSNTKALVPGQ